MKIQTQPEVDCPRCQGRMTGHGCTGTQDLYHCEGCGKMEWRTWQERRGSARKRAVDDPIELVAVSGVIEIYKLEAAYRFDKLECQSCGTESLLMDTYKDDLEGWVFWGTGCMKSPMCPECFEFEQSKLES